MFQLSFFLKSILKERQAKKKFLILPFIIVLYFGLKNNLYKFFQSFKKQKNILLFLRIFLSELFNKFLFKKKLCRNVCQEFSVKNFDCKSFCFPRNQFLV